MTANLPLILLADDDEDDCMFFKDALEELSLPVCLKTLSNGVELMNYLKGLETDFPKVLFLDLNMPRKTGFECLSEIKHSDKLRHLPVVIFTTSNNPTVINKLYGEGAHYFIRKPASFTNLKAVINKVVSLLDSNNGLPPKKDTFLIKPEN